MPGFIDLQINGAHGIDVMSATAADLLRLSQHLAIEGTTGWLPTVITSSLDRIERVDAVIGEAIAAQQEMGQDERGAGSLPGATILGMHLEGPFISPERLGAHPQLNLHPLAEIWNACSGSRIFGSSHSHRNSTERLTRSPGSLPKE